MRNTRRFTSLAVALLAAAMLVTDALAQTSMPVQIAFSPSGRDVMLYVAMEKGYFAEAGLDVTVATGDGGGNMARNTDQGQFLIGHGVDFSVLLQMLEAGSDLKGIMVLNARSPYGFQSFAEKGITTPKDFEGASIGIEPGSIGESILRLLSEVNDVDYEAIDIIPMDGSVYVQSIMQDRMDMISGFRDSLFGVVKFQADLQDRELNAVWASDWGLDTYGTLIVAKEQFLQEQPEVARGFLEALRKAVEFSRENPDEAVAITARQVTGLNPAIVRIQLDEWLATAQDQTTEEQGIGCASMEKAQESIDVFREALGMEEPVSAEELFTNEYMTWCNE
jgi:NitT/TauT family transport system substrate-binding protein